MFEGTVCPGADAIHPYIVLGEWFWRMQQALLQRPLNCLSEVLVLGLVLVFTPPRLWHRCPLVAYRLEQRVLLQLRECNVISVDAAGIVGDYLGCVGSYRTLRWHLTRGAQVARWWRGAGRHSEENVCRG